MPSHVPITAESTAEMPTRKTVGQILERMTSHTGSRVSKDSPKLSWLVSTT